MIEFFVPGIPQPQGSKRAFVIRKNGALTNRVAITEDNKKVAPWRDSVIYAAMKQPGSGCCASAHVPVWIVMEFRFRRPSGHHGKAGLNAQGRRRPFPTGKPDGDKLERAVNDALTGILFHDDSQVVQVSKSKSWTDGPPGMLCKVFLDEAEYWAHQFARAKLRVAESSNTVNIEGET